MHTPRRRQGFTLIELLTVIAIIAILVAILFPVAATLREQARAGDCLSKLHQLYVAASVYRDDEGDFPPTLLGYAERVSYRPDGTKELVDPEGGDSDSVEAVVAAGAMYRVRGEVAADRIINGFLLGEQVRDINVFRCPDNVNVPKNLVTIAHYPPRPERWPAATWIGEELASAGCPTDAYGTIDCFTEGPHRGKPKYYYVWDSYDIGPRIGPDGRPIDAGGQRVYDIHYSRDWTGVRGASDMTNQLKYRNPPLDRTLLAYCSWHGATAGANTFTAVTAAGSAKKIKYDEFLRYGANLYNK